MTCYLPKKLQHVDFHQNNKISMKRRLHVGYIHHPSLGRIPVPVALWFPLGLTYVDFAASNFIDDPVHGMQVKLKDLIHDLPDLTHMNFHDNMFITGSLSDVPERVTSLELPQQISGSADDLQKRNHMLCHDYRHCWKDYCKGWHGIDCFSRD